MGGGVEWRDGGGVGVWVCGRVGSGRGEGVIGKLGGRAGSPHYWGWIAFAGRSRVILCRQHQHQHRYQHQDYNQQKLKATQMRVILGPRGQHQHYNSHHRLIKASIIVKWGDTDTYTVISISISTSISNSISINIKIIESLKYLDPDQQSTRC